MDPNGTITILVTTYDGGAGTHSAVYTDDGGNGEAFLYDPAGSYSSGGGRGSSDFFSGADANLESYIGYHQNAGSTVRLQKLNTDISHQTNLRNSAIQNGGCIGGLCALATSGVLSNSVDESLRGYWTPDGLFDAVGEFSNDPRSIFYNGGGGGCSP